MKSNAAHKDEGDIAVLDKPAAAPVKVAVNDGVNVTEAKVPEGETIEQPNPATGDNTEQPTGEGNTDETHDPDFNGDQEEENEEVITIGPRGLVMVVSDEIPAEFSLERRPPRTRWGFSEMVPGGHVVVEAAESTKAIATVSSLNSQHKDDGQLWRTRPVPGTDKKAKKGTYDIEVWRIR